MRFPRRGTRAFTLIELIVVVIVLGILMAVVLPNFFGASTSAKNSVATQYLTTAYRDLAGQKVASADGAYPDAATMASRAYADEPELSFAVGSAASASDGPKTIVIERTGDDGVVLGNQSSSGAQCTLTVSAATNYAPVTVCVAATGGGTTTTTEDTTPTEVAFWRLDDTNSTLVNSSSAGALYNGTWAAGVTHGVAGATSDGNKASSFWTYDGSNQTGTIPYAAALNPASFTVEAWVKPNSPFNNEYVVGEDGGANCPASGGFNLALSGASSPWAISASIADCPDNTWYGISTDASSAPVTGTWYLLDVTLDASGNFDLYVDGTHISHADVPHYTPSTTSPLTISGSSSTQNHQVDGSVDDVSIWNGALSASAIAARYANR